MMARTATKKQIKAFKELRDALRQITLRENEADSFFRTLWKEMDRLKCWDYDYREHCANYRFTSIAIEHLQEMDFNECCTWLTLEINRNKYCEGQDKCTDEGYIEALLNRLCEFREKKGKIKAFKKLRDMLENVKAQDRAQIDFWFTLRDKMVELDCLDVDFMEHAENWKDIRAAVSRVNEMGFDECCTWLTCALAVSVDERGYFAYLVERGDIEALLNRICGMAA